MFAQLQKGWLRRMEEEDIGRGLSAEAAVGKRTILGTEARMGQASDAYLRETAVRLDDLSNRCCVYF